MRGEGEHDQVGVQAVPQQIRIRAAEVDVPRTSREEQESRMELNNSSELSFMG